MFNAAELAELDSPIPGHSKRSKTEIEREEASAATGQAVGARPQARPTGPKTRKRSKTAHALSSSTRAGTVPVLATGIGNAIMHCAKAVRDAGLMREEEAGGPADFPEWNEVPTDCGFKRKRCGRQGHVTCIDHG